MSILRPRLPQETVDHIVDFLHDNWKELRKCCLVSKSWLPRARKHLFVDLEFESEDYDKWVRVFPNPINSPAHHVRILTIRCRLQAVGASSWIQGFTRVDRLTVDYARSGCTIPCIPLVLFYTLAASLKTLEVTYLLLPHTEIFDLVRSLPLLEDLILTGDGIVAEDDEPDEPPTVVSSIPPALTGTLELFMYTSLGRALQQLLDLPGGLRFRKLDLSWCRPQDLHQVVETVAACSNTLEHLTIASKVGDEEIRVPINLCKATKLKEVLFRCGSLVHECGWVITSLKTITADHRDLQQISIRVPYPSDEGQHRRTMIGGETARPGMRWSDLDRLLVQLWESRSVRLRIVLPWTRDKTRANSWAAYLLPETTKRGVIINPADEPDE